ncbi:protein of unknown function [Magnetospirillum sp. XM-1]|uniref:hypothetical protein n=1 Tax=Magnetospirillum sp. XM-1 TaxID=1663591 RepID=UPI00073DE25C|nr:hypothetical protein [Magnetospirillum sp. XM-1]CUW38711.1 protein of unknown function [Magnetospirillum sp. XM-1]
MHVMLFTFYWTAKQEVERPVCARPGDDVEAAISKSLVMTTQKAMADTLVRKLVRNGLIDELSGHTLIEYAYSEGADDDLQDEVFQHYVREASADSSRRYIFVSPFSYIGRWRKMTRPKCRFAHYKQLHPTLFPSRSEAPQDKPQAVSYNMDITDTINTEAWVVKIEKAYQKAISNRKRSNRMRKLHKSQRKQLARNANVENVVGFPQYAREEGARKTAQLHAERSAELGAKLGAIASAWTITRAITWTDIAKKLNDEKYALTGTDYTEWNAGSLRSRSSRGTIPSIDELKKLARKR